MYVGMFFLGRVIGIGQSYLVVSVINAFKYGIDWGNCLVLFHPYNAINRHKFFFLQTSADIGVIGLAVMGQNLILNLNDHGYAVCAFNRLVKS